MSQPDEVLRGKLKDSLWFAVGKMVDEETARLGTTATPQFIGALTEMVWAQLENTAIDLESFARHAGRTIVNADDVLLITRRNEALHDIMKEYIESEKATESGKPKGKAKKKA